MVVALALVRCFYFKVPTTSTPKSQRNDGLNNLFRNIPGLIMTDLGMVSLTGWDFVRPVRRHDPALPIFIVTTLPLHFARGVYGIVTAFSQTLRDFDMLITAIQQLIVEFREVQTASPSRA
jgi:DNA-binding NtrC family response regulator